MKGVINAVAAFVQSVRRVYTRKWSFLTVFAFAFCASAVMLAWLDLLPNPPRASGDANISVATTTDALGSEIVEDPVRIEIPSMKRSVSVLNPDSTDIEMLDAALLKGAVRYPTSAQLGEEGNVVLFGHSSYLPLVNNQAMKSFNDIQKLKVGEEIRVYGEAAVYVYHVRSVERQSAETGAIALSPSGKVLTLATCNSFGAKEDRFVVTADFVESYPAAS